MSQQNSQNAKHDRIDQILKMLQAGLPREKIADQFGYRTWKSLDIYMRRHGFSWDSQRQIYTNAMSHVQLREESKATPIVDGSSLTDVTPEEIVRLFGTGILDAREIAKKTGFTGHKEMAAFMLRCGYVWSPSTLNYINSNPSSSKSCLDTYRENENNLQYRVRQLTNTSLAEDMTSDKYSSLLEFLWQSREKLIRVIESMNDGDKIQVYNIPGQAKTKSIFLSDRLSDLMSSLCEKHSLSQKQGYEAALVEYLSKNGFRDRVEQLLDVRNTIKKEQSSTPF